MSETSKLSTVQYSYSLPSLTTLLPCRAHPDTRTVGRQTREWCQSFPEVTTWACHFRGLPPQTSVEQWLDEGFADIWPGRCFPMASKERLRIAFDMSCWMTMADDALSRPGPFRYADAATQIAALDRAIDIVGGEGARTEPGHSVDPRDELVLGRLLADCWYRFARLAPAPVRARVEVTFREMLESWKDEAHDRRHGHDLDFATFVRERDRRSGGGTTFAWAEFLLEIDLTAERALYVTDLGELEQLVCRYFALTNDIYSLRNECIDGDAMMNSVAVLSRRENVSISAALHTVAAAAEEAERDFLRVRGQFVVDNPGITAALHSYLSFLGDAMAATAFYFRASPRYHGVGHDWSEVDGGSVVLSDEHSGELR